MWPPNKSKFQPILPPYGYWYLNLSCTHRKSISTQSMTRPTTSTKAKITFTESSSQTHYNVEFGVWIGGKLVSHCSLWKLMFPFGVPLLFFSFSALFWLPKLYFQVVAALSNVPCNRGTTAPHQNWRRNQFFSVPFHVFVCRISFWMSAAAESRNNKLIRKQYYSHKIA